MSTQHSQRTNNTQRTKIPDGEWMRCQSVTGKDGTLHCLLDRTKTYDLVKAYKRGPHIQFVNAKSDKELMDFFRNWGPLLADADAVDGVIRLGLDDCRLYQAYIRALIVAVDAFRHGRDERSALVWLLRSDHATYTSDEAITKHLPNHDFESEEDLVNWIQHARISEVRDELADMVRWALWPVQCTLKLTSGRNGTRRVEAGWRTSDLQAALLWMVWYDEFTNHPVVCCEECLKVFRGKTARARKYCSTKCGHKATAREAMRRKRATARAERK